MAIKLAEKPNFEDRSSVFLSFLVLACDRSRRAQVRYFVLSFCLATRRRMKLGPFLAWRPQRATFHACLGTLPATVSRWSVPKREEATNVSSPFHLVCRIISVKKRIAYLRDTPAF